MRLQPSTIWRRCALAGLAVGLSSSVTPPVGAADHGRRAGSGSEQTAQPAPAANAPVISPIDASSSTCDRVDDGSERCFIEWPYVYVSAAAGQYMINLKIAIDGRLRANTQGFFQESMYVPTGMYGSGFGVDCGQPGAGGFADSGRSYVVSITARDSAGAEANTTTTVLCPYTLHIFSDGFESHDTSAWSARAP